jgi:alpha-beta hydrolase superfamily lysophospholipase
MNCNTPYLLLSGEMDPVSNYGKGINNIAQKFNQAKINNTTVKLFEEGRHEMLNEINKLDVYNYIYNWLKKNFYD